MAGAAGPSAAIAASRAASKGWYAWLSRSIAPCQASSSTTYTSRREPGSRSRRSIPRRAR